MRETETDSIVPAAFLAPLRMEALAPAVQKVVSGSGPAKSMAARGIGPLRPPELAVAVFQLSFDADPAVNAAAQAAPKTLPDAVLLPLLKEPLAPSVLHFFATRLPEQRTEALQAVLHNASTDDATICVLSSRLPAPLLEVVFNNETRLLRCPTIVKVLFANKAARMSSVNRAMELCARNGVTVDVPGFEEMVQEIRQTPSALDAAIDETFANVAALTAQVELEVPDRLPDVSASAGDVDAEHEAEEAAPAAPLVGTTSKVESKRKSPIIDFTKLKIYEKIRLATFGNAYCRTNLIRDSNRLVAMAVIKSPMLTDSEVIQAAANKAVHEDVIRYIANSREFTKLYATRWALVNNPKCPLTVAMRLLGTLAKNDLKKIAKSKNVPAALTTTARRMVGNAQG